MAKETKSIAVSPSDEQAKIDLWMDFGWELQDSKPVVTPSSSRLENRGGDIYQVTTAGENYVKLIFTRDKSIANYDAIVSLENEYNTEIAKLWDYTDGPHLNLFWFISFLFYGIGLLIFIILKVINKKKDEETYQHNAPILERCKELRGKAKGLIE